MKFASQHLQSATAILEAYDGAVPLHHFLKGYFAANKKYGSKDRRSISHLCYAYFRLGHAVKELAAAERITIALYLSAADEWKVLFPAGWQLHDNMEARLEQVKQQYPMFAVEDIFPFHPVSEGLKLTAFSLSHLRQPKLFIRTRPGKTKAVQAKLDAANIAYEQPAENIFSFTNNTRLEDVLTLHKEYVVQDLSSQRVGNMMKLPVGAGTVWDCCAASGGKAIMAYDLLQVQKLLVTDVRDSIIKNLVARFRESGIRNYNHLVVDVTNEAAVKKALGKQLFNLVICDAPCSGSGTWGRTPEQLYYFSTDKIKHYSELQKKIAVNAAQHVAAGGYFLYITCSVLQQENEDVVDWILKHTPLQLAKKELLKGYDEYADSMFAALFVAPA
ncbi:Fmu (Sun) domain-containing protein [Aridibaculum aurantiacum]|uniref:Fmu (Sun) domain-containing protein n=1 Tax=Aridibaculum aurantiacum TaxID=2810307 RepID=UPI001A96B182|nr:Fmu (Sun) domain-containing protein [Aridibaculum aurantiacum]